MIDLITILADFFQGLKTPTKWSKLRINALSYFFFNWNLVKMGDFFYCTSGNFVNLYYYTTKLDINKIIACYLIPIDINDPTFKGGNNITVCDSPPGGILDLKWMNSDKYHILVKYATTQIGLIKTNLEVVDIYFNTQNESDLFARLQNIYPEYTTKGGFAKFSATRSDLGGCVLTKSARFG